MALSDRILDDLKTATKARDEVAKQTLRMLRSDLTAKEIELGRPLEEAEEIAVLTSAVKMRRDALAEYEKAGRDDLAANERAQIEIVQRYLPKQLDEAEARDAIRALASELGVSSKKEMGKLMKAVMERYRGQIDGKLASRLAGEILS
ncbi:MAG TPA: GatB/YqeY domain-containing protein [Sandaracinaceae bacterium]